MEQILDELMAEGKIERSKRGKFSKSEVKKITGTFLAHPKGFGFVSIEGETDDIFIPEADTNGAMHMDIVEVSVSPVTTGKRKEGKVLNILERGMKQVVCPMTRASRLITLSSHSRRLHTTATVSVPDTRGLERTMSGCTG